MRIRIHQLKKNKKRRTKKKGTRIHQLERGTVTHPIILGRHWEDYSSRPAWAKSSSNPISTNGWAQ
jgi:hypothetical protein